jgi:hypothetical protein
MMHLIPVLVVSLLKLITSKAYYSFLNASTGLIPEVLKE